MPQSPSQARTLKSRLAAGETVRCCAVGRLLSPSLVRMVARSGLFGAVWVDHEHCGPGPREIEGAVLAAAAEGVECFVRLSPAEAGLVTRVLELGACGVMAARVDSAAEAEAFADAAKFFPDGRRGVNHGGADGDFGLVALPDHLPAANARTFVAVQIETPDAVACVGEIAALPHVDHLFLGPADLSVALGVPGEWLHPAMTDAVGRLAAACAAHGKSWGTVPGGAEHRAFCVEHGCRLLSDASDVKLVRLGLAAVA